MIFVAMRMLSGDRAKYLGILFGVALATLLIVHQVTIFAGLMSRTWSIVRDVRDSSGMDLLVADPSTEFLNDARALPSTAADRVRSIAGVQWAEPMMLSTIRASLAGGRYRTCVVVGVDDGTLTGAPARLAEGRVEDLRRADGVIVDRIDGQKLLSGLVSGEGVVRAPRVGDVLELNERRAEVVGVSENTRPFLSQPIIYTTISRARSWMPPERRSVAYVLVKVAPGHSVADVAAAVEAGTGLAAYTPGEFGWRTIGYFLRNTGIPVNFGITIALGCVVGAAITGQTFYMFVLDNLRQLAALKAMGASNRQLITMTGAQALLVGVLGYGLGVLGALLMIVPFKGTELEFDVYWQTLALAAGLVAVIISLACLTSLWRVLRLEPAVVFKG